MAPDEIAKDLAFFDGLLKKLSADYKIDADRVYAVGMSNGGYFEQLVGKERSKVVAAACCHSGSLGPQSLFGIAAERRFPVMIIHGVKDRVNSIDIARENCEKYKREWHEVLYAEMPTLHHWCAGGDINNTILT